VWDLRKTPTCHCDLRAARAPITSISWHPTDDCALAVSSAEDTTTLWDIAVEKDGNDLLDLGILNSQNVGKIILSNICKDYLLIVRAI
jgi:WD40 repeat protein